MKNNIVERKSVCSKDCYGSCSLKLQIRSNEILKVSGDNESPVSHGLLCKKGRNYPQFLAKEKRLTRPLIRDNKADSNSFREISWDEAYELLHDKLQKIKENYGPKAILYYQGAGDFGLMSFEYAKGFWYQYGGCTTTIGTLCDIAGSTAIESLYGERKQNSREDLANTELIILWGKNPHCTDIHVMKHINQAIKHGANLICIDPRETESSAKAHIHIKPQSGTDGLLAIGIAKLLIDEDLIDQQFIDQHVKGYESYRNYVDSIDMEDIVTTTGVSLEYIRKVAFHIGRHPQYALVCGSGIQRYTNGGQTSRLIALLPALTGSIGRSGAGLYYRDDQTYSLRWPFVPPEPKDIRESIPVAQAASLLANQKNPEIRLMWIERANPLVSNPNTNKFRREMKKIDFTVVVDLFMTDTALEADMVLPAASLFEKDDIFTSHGTPYIQVQEKIIEPLGESKSEFQIYRELAEKFNFDCSYLPLDFDYILRDFIDFNNLEVSPEEMKRSPYLPPNYQLIAFQDYVFKTKSGKIELFSQEIADKWGINPVPTYHSLSDEISGNQLLKLVSYHSSNRINSQEMTRTETEEFLEISSIDATIRQLKNGDNVEIFNNRGCIQRKVLVNHTMESGIAFLVFGGSGGQGGTVNELTDDRTTDIGHGAAFHGYFVNLRKIEY